MEEFAKPSFSADAFVGTALYYAQYRVPYPPRLLDNLLSRARVSGAGRLLDLACGPGRVALAISSSFEEVWAIDLEPEMIETGRRQAAQRGLNNLRWIIGRAEDLQAPATSFELVTIGDAFHRLDQRVVAAQTKQWLKPGCCLAILGSGYGILSGSEPWQRAVIEVVEKWTNRRVSRAGASSPSDPGGGPKQIEWALGKTGFEDVASVVFIESHTWTIETIVGHLYSTSVCSRKVLGDKSQVFELDLTAALLAFDKSGLYSENTQFGYTLGRKASASA